MGPDGVAVGLAPHRVVVADRAAELGHLGLAAAPRRGRASSARPRAPPVKVREPPRRAGPRRVLVARATARACARCARRRRPRRTPPIAMPTPPMQPSTSATTTPGAPGTLPSRPHVRTANDAASRMPQDAGTDDAADGALLATGQRAVRRLEREDRVEREQDAADDRRSQQRLVRADASLPSDRIGVVPLANRGDREVGRARSDETRAAEVVAHLTPPSGVASSGAFGVETRRVRAAERRLRVVRHGGSPGGRTSLTTSGCCRSSFGGSALWHGRR